MSKSLVLLFSSSLLVTACGDNTLPAQPDAGSGAPDAPAPDARVCNTDNYPEAMRMASVDLAQPFALTLDGVGTRCEQLVRALTDPDPSRRPPELAELDVDGVIGSCVYADDIGRDIVRLFGPQVGGLPLFGVIQDAVIHVEAPATVVHLHGDFLPVIKSPPGPACLDDAQLAAPLPGTALTYARFDQCAYQGEGDYTVASTDVVEVGEEGYLLDHEGLLRRVRAVDVYLRPENVTAEIINSDLYCCAGQSLDHCVGARVFVDALTGERVQQQQHCHAC